MSVQRRLLIVDSSHIVHTVCRMLLASYAACSVSAISAMDVREGMELLRNNPDVEVILLDMTESFERALGFLQSLQTASDDRRWLVVMLINPEQLAEVTRGLLAGAYSYLEKPLTQRGLFLHLDIAFGFDI